MHGKLQNLLQADTDWQIKDNSGTLPFQSKSGSQNPKTIETIIKWSKENPYGLAGRREMLSKINPLPVNIIKI